ncbi:MAG: pyridoxamine 5'-phosphate oxidase family protein [Burkholderiaceae bacterium]
MTSGDTSKSAATGNVFHPGELMVQERAGVAASVAAIGQHNIRPFMPQQHRRFFENLSTLFYGALDSAGRPWAAMLTGAAGFVQSPTETVLTVNANPLPGDPVYSQLCDGDNIALLGLELNTRRRNRANGQISKIDSQGLQIRIKQSFGNCPKYIQRRDLIAVAKNTAINTGAEAAACNTDDASIEFIESSSILDARHLKIIAQADTFFISSVSSPKDVDSAEATEAACGPDVSHRGGKPGFISVHSNKLVWPDYAGNNFFNTLGNIAVNPAVGLLIPHFHSGDLLYMTGHAEIVWEESAVADLPGAQRLVSFEATQTRLASGALNLRYTEAEPSPFLP